MPQSRTDDASFDVLVLGGGAAGCVLAARLSKDPGRRVGLVEAGPDYGSYESGRWPASLLDARVDGALTYLAGGEAEAHDWGFEGGLSSSRAKVIGGCSSHNGCEVLWGAPADYDAWAGATGDPSWSYARLRPYLERAHATILARGSAVGDLGAIRRALLSAGREIGLAELPDLNLPDAVVGVGCIPVNAVGVVRWGAAFAYLDPARGRPNLTIIPDALVDRVVIRDGRAMGATVIQAGMTRTLRAGSYILAAGSYGTPAILQRSGIGPAGALRAAGIEPNLDRAGVGSGLLDHPYVLLSWAARERLRNADARHAAMAPPLALSEVKWASGRCRPGSWDITIGAWSGAVFDQRAHRQRPHEAGLAPCAMGSRSRGSVRIRSASPTVLPAVEHGFLSDPEGHDLAVLREGVGVARDLGASRAWRYWCGDEIVPGLDSKGAELDRWIRAGAAGTYHPCGTGRMGRPDDPDAVVDSRGRLLGVEAVMVADASIFPTIPAANIQLSVLAVAEKLAETLD